MGISTNGKRLFIARHGETVFNRIARMQGQAEVHTPLTWEGCVQAKMMGRALANYLGSDARPELWSSSAQGGRCRRWRLSLRKSMPTGIRHSETTACWKSTWANGRAALMPIFPPKSGRLWTWSTNCFRCRPDGGEYYDDVAARLSHWIGEQMFEQDMLIICHGMTARVLRGLLLGHEPMEHFGAPIAPSLSQGQHGDDPRWRGGTVIVSGEGAAERA